MANKFALIVAVEHYSDPKIPRVEFAEADATAFGSAIRLHGYDDAKTLLSAKATKSSIESHLRRGIQRLTADDEFIFYYAGHGFSNNGHNFITCSDTDISDLDKTSVSLQEVFDLIEKSPCKRVAVFLDCCESGITRLTKRRGIYGAMSENELDEFFRGSEYRVCFSACKTAESSYPSTALKHGIWTYHLIEALSGDAPKALEKGHRLTAMSLQNYLSDTVPRTLRKAYSTPEVQTPWLYGGQSRDFQIADLADILAKRAEAKPGYEQLKRTLFREIESIHIKSLSGFGKNHHVPDYVSNSTKNFVESISADDVEELCDQVFDEIKKQFKYKRQDLTYESSRIVAPDFEYAAWCEQDDSNPEKALLFEELTNVKPSIIADDRFNAVFDGTFSQLVFEFPRKLNVAELIDSIEEADREDIEIDYPKDSSWCEITFEGSDVTVEVKGRELTVVSPSASTPRALLDAFFNAQKLLAGTPIPALLTAKQNPSKGK